jgi:hypothetical protein
MPNTVAGLASTMRLTETRSELVTVLLRSSDRADPSEIGQFPALGAETVDSGDNSMKPADAEPLLLLTVGPLGISGHLGDDRPD